MKKQEFELFHLESYEDYTGKQIYPTVKKTSTAGILIILIYLINEFLFKSDKENFYLYFIGYSMGIILIILMILGAHKKNTKQIIICGNISVVVLSAINIFVSIRIPSIYHIFLLFMFGAIIVAPLLSLKLFLIPNILINIIVVSFLFIENIDLMEIKKFALFSMTSSFFLTFILKNLRENAIAEYRINMENRYYSNYDVLSGLFNRRAWYSKAEKLFEENNIVFMIFFKKINDTLGHHCGDYVISRVSEILRLNAPKDSLIGRLGGEEFGIIYADLPSEKNIQIAEKLRRAIEETKFRYNDKEFNVTLSIGLVSYKDKNLEETIKLADKKLYEAKETGRNRVMG